MAKNIQEIVAIIDRSGSMYGKETNTIGGINTMINELKEKKDKDEEIFLSIKLFDHEQKILYDSINIDNIKQLDVNDLVPRGQTALLDAIGDTLSQFIEKKLSNNGVFKSCIIYVATDGYENASKRYSKEKIKKIISNAELNYNISMVYLGANQDAIMEAASIGIKFDSAINYCENTDNINSVYRSVARVASTVRKDGSAPSFTQQERYNSNTISNETPRPPLLRRQTDIALTKN